ncbi:MAG: phospholipid/cholesterol/gamma-HCH transport system permease protein, partial [Verrucomicrobiota bacterium]
MQLARPGRPLRALCKGRLFDDRPELPFPCARSRETYMAHDTLKVWHRHDQAPKGKQSDSLLSRRVTSINVVSDATLPCRHQHTPTSHQTNIFIRMNEAGAKIPRADAWTRFWMKAPGLAGSFALAQWRQTQYLAAVLGTTLFLGAQPRRWQRTVRGAFAQQVLLSGVESIRFILILAFLVGISVVVQLDVWTGRLGQSQQLGPLLVAVVARELGPLFANFVLIV